MSAPALQRLSWLVRGSVVDADFRFHTLKLLMEVCGQAGMNSIREPRGVDCQSALTLLRIRYRIYLAEICLLKTILKLGNDSFELLELTGNYLSPDLAL